MKFTAFKETNLYLGPGNNKNTVGIGVCVVIDTETNYPVMFGKVQITDEELEMIKERKSFYIGVVGSQWAPMFVMTENPVTECEGRFERIEIG